MYAKFKIVLSLNTDRSNPFGIHTGKLLLHPSTGSSPVPMQAGTSNSFDIGVRSGMSSLLVMADANVQIELFKCGVLVHRTVTNALVIRLVSAGGVPEYSAKVTALTPANVFHCHS